MPFLRQPYTIDYNTYFLVKYNPSPAVSARSYSSIATAVSAAHALYLQLEQWRRNCQCFRVATGTYTVTVTDAKDVRQQALTMLQQPQLH